MNQSSFIPRSSFIAHLCLSVSAAARRFNSHAVARFELVAAFGRDASCLAVTNDRVTACAPVFAAAESIRRAFSSVGEQGHTRGHERFDFADDAITSASISLPARTFANGVAAHAQRVSIFESFGGAVEAVP